MRHLYGALLLLASALLAGCQEQNGDGYGMGIDFNNMYTRQDYLRVMVLGPNTENTTEGWEQFSIPKGDDDGAGVAFYCGPEHSPWWIHIRLAEYEEGVFDGPPKHLLDDKRWNVECDTTYGMLIDENGRMTLHEEGKPHRVIQPVG